MLCVHTHTLSHTHTLWTSAGVAGFPQHPGSPGDGPRWPNQTWQSRSPHRHWPVHCRCSQWVRGPPGASDGFRTTGDLRACATCRRAGTGTNLPVDRPVPVAGRHIVTDSSASPFWADLRKTARRASERYRTQVHNNTRIPSGQETGATHGQSTEKWINHDGTHR